MGKIHSLLRKPEQFHLVQVEVLNPTVLGQRLCSLRVASVGPSGYPTGRLQGLFPMAVVTRYPGDICRETGDQVTRAK